MAEACKACGGRGWTDQDWDEEAEDFGKEVSCPHCSGEGVDWWEDEGDYE